jgi:hypothetical protein
MLGGTEIATDGCGDRQIRRLSSAGRRMAVPGTGSTARTVTKESTGSGPGPTSVGLVGLHVERAGCDPRRFDELAQLRQGGAQCFSAQVAAPHEEHVQLAVPQRHRQSHRPQVHGCDVDGHAVSPVDTTLVNRENRWG